MLHSVAQRGVTRVAPRWVFAFVVPRIPRESPWAFESRPFEPNRKRSSQSDCVRDTHSCERANQCLNPNREVITTPFLSRRGAILNTHLDQLLSQRRDGVEVRLQFFRNHRSRYFLQERHRRTGTTLDLNKDARQFDSRSQR